mgnify:FL=1
MSILLFAESHQRKLKKGSTELSSYGFALAKQQNTTFSIVTVNCEDADQLANYGASKLFNLKLSTNHFEAHAYATALAEIATKEDAKIILISSSADAKYMGGILAGKLQAGYGTNIVGLPVSNDPLIVKRSVFRNKAFANTIHPRAINILSLIHIS